MNILHLNTYYEKGGASQISSAIFKKNEKNDKYSSSFTFGRGENIKIKKVYKFTYKPEIYLHGFITRLTGYEGVGSYFSTKRLIKYIESKEIDLVHLHNIHGYYLNLSFINYLKKNKYPVVWTFHDAWPFTGSCAYYFDCYKWKSGCGNCPNLKTYPKNYIDQSKNMWIRKQELFSSGWKPVIITPSQWLANEANKSFLRNHRIKVINNGININTFKPRNNKNIREKLNIPLNKKVVLFVAADLEDKRKGAEYFFEALSYLKNDNYMVVAIGKEYNKQFNNIDIEIKQLGYIHERESLSEIYSMSDVFCTTSLDEVFGLTVTEALSSGTPVVAFDVGGITEQIKNNCGFTVEVKKTKELAQKIALLLEDKKLNKKMSQKAREKAVNNYSIEKMVSEYIKVYDELLEG
jgi:glycosyltransferase involved in cell wall biosynthesis